MDINAEVARGMYEAIQTYGGDEGAAYRLFHHGLCFERIAESDYDGTFCKMEWFTHVCVKNDQ